MKAIVWTKYGPPEVLQLQEVEKPTPKDNEVLVKIHATTVTAGDCEMRSLDFPIYLSLAMRIWRGFLKPREGSIPGSEFAGAIEAVGKDVTVFKVGDEVFGSGGMGFGAHAEYICLPERPGDMEGAVAHKPANMTFDEAATVPFGGRDALHFLRKGGIQSGQRLLINGAGGSIGTFAVQLAKHYGAEVTAVDSAPKLDMLRAIGSDAVIDYTREDVLKDGALYDVIFDVVGKLSVSQSMGSLKPAGVFLSANPRISQMVQGIWARMRTDHQVIMTPAAGTVEDLVFLRGLIEADEITTVIDRRFPLEDMVEAHRYVERGGKLGNLVITVGGGAL